LCIPVGLLVFFVCLHVLNGWGWVCARWAELLLVAAPQAPANAATVLPATDRTAPAPLVSVSPPPAPVLPPVPAPPPAPAPPQTPVMPLLPEAPTAPQSAVPAQPSEAPAVSGAGGSPESESN
jgi:2-oxoglutarate dehydrogenase E2 component (dihydrolipoamide succinyltransferase)